MKKQGLMKFIGSIAVIAILVFALPTFSNAAVLQANPTTGNNATQPTGTTFFLNIRKMENPGQSMGLSESTASGTLLATTPSNNIDVHMMKNTEYGALAILSASGFGNPANTNTITTSTGNRTGVVFKAKLDWVAAGLTSGTGSTEFVNAADRYYNMYTTSKTNTKPGDALDLIWRNPTATTWVASSGVTFSRGGGNGLFAYYAYQPNHSTATFATARAVVVNGIGF